MNKPIIAIVLTGFVKKYKLAFRSIQKNIINANPNFHFKIFLNIVNCYDTKYNSSYNINIDEILNFCNPTDYIVTENNYIIYENVLCDYNKYVNAVYNQYTNISKCLELVYKYEQNNKMKFHLILRTRFDLYIVKPYIFPIIKENTIYIEYMVDPKYKFNWNSSLQINLEHNYNLIYNNLFFPDHTLYLPDLFFFSSSDSLKNFINIPTIILNNYKIFDTLPQNNNLTTWFSYPEKLFYLVILINNLNINIIGQGYTSLLHDTNKHSIHYLNDKYKINYSQLVPFLNFYGSLNFTNCPQNIINMFNTIY